MSEEESKSLPESPREVGVRLLRSLSNAVLVAAATMSGFLLVMGLQGELFPYGVVFWLGVVPLLMIAWSLRVSAHGMAGTSMLYTDQDAPQAPQAPLRDGQA